MAGISGFRNRNSGATNIFHCNFQYTFGSILKAYNFLYYIENHNGKIPFPDPNSDWDIFAQIFMLRPIFKIARFLNFWRWGVRFIKFWKLGARILNEVKFKFSYGFLHHYDNKSNQSQRDPELFSRSKFKFHFI